MLRQYELIHEQDRSVQVVWLEHDARVKRGTRISLKHDEPGTRWIVNVVYETLLDHKDIKRGWNNNI